MRIELTPEIESALVRAAQRQGTTPELVAEAYLRERLDVATVDERAAKAKTLADFLAGYIGILGTDVGEVDDRA
jgi:hypothetical protein